MVYNQWYPVEHEMMPSQDPCLIHGMNPSFGVEYWPWLVVPNMLYFQHCSTIESANTSIIEKNIKIMLFQHKRVSKCGVSPYPQSNVAIRGNGESQNMCWWFSHWTQPPFILGICQPRLTPEVSQSLTGAMISWRTKIFPLELRHHIFRQSLKYP